VETERATNAESDIRQSVSAEGERATAAESALGTRLTTVEPIVASNTGRIEAAETEIQTMQPVVQDSRQKISDLLQWKNDLEFVKDVEFNDTTGDLKITYEDNRYIVANIPIATLFSDIDYDRDKHEIVIKRRDGSEMRLNIAYLIDVYTGFTGTHIQIDVDGNNVIRATLRAGSITEAELAAALLNKINSKANQSDLTAHTGNTAIHVTQTDKDGWNSKAAKGDPGFTPVKGIDYFDGYTPIKGVDYFDGEQGEKGDPGAPGFTPVKGIDYFDGYTPIKGVDYTDGEDGQKGDPGPPGFTPQKGIDYFDGYTPIKGVDYFDGEQGEKGDPGPPGFTPVKGIDYFDGEKGDKGDDGDDGQKGDPGFTPVKGIDYFDGYTPIKGVDYTDGEDGQKGDKGDKGDPGEKGDKGEKGEKGDRGVSGSGAVSVNESLFNALSGISFDRTVLLNRAGINYKWFFNGDGFAEVSKVNFKVTNVMFNNWGTSIVAYFPMSEGRLNEYICGCGYGIHLDSKRIVELIFEWGVVDNNEVVSFFVKPEPLLPDGLDGYDLVMTYYVTYY
jgi:hypothetical protein